MSQTQQMFAMLLLHSYLASCLFFRCSLWIFCLFCALVSNWIFRFISLNFFFISFFLNRFLIYFFSLNFISFPYVFCSIADCCNCCCKIQFSLFRFIFCFFSFFGWKLFFRKFQNFFPFDFNVALRLLILGSANRLISSL